jgi:hypothetical protein
MVGIYDVNCEYLSSSTVNLLMVASFILGFLFFRRFRVKKQAEGAEEISLNLQMPVDKLSGISLDDETDGIDVFPIH